MSRRLRCKERTESHLAGVIIVSASAAKWKYMKLQRMSAEAAGGAFSFGLQPESLLGTSP